MAANDPAIFRLEQRVIAAEAELAQLRRLLMTDEMVNIQRQTLTHFAAMLSELYGTLRLIQTKGVQCVARAAADATPPAPEQTPEERLAGVAQMIMTVAAAAGDDADSAG